MILDADVEHLLIEALPALLAAHGVSTPVGSRAQGSESVAVFRTGGDRRSVVSDEPQVTFDVRARSEARASQVALLVRAVVLGLPGARLAGHQVYRVDGLGLSNLPDPNFSGARYRWSAFIHLRSQVIPS